MATPNRFDANGGSRGENLHRTSDPFRLFETQDPGSSPSSPVSFINTLACQVKLLACMKWLGEFHILPMIPLQGGIPMTEIAELAGVPAVQLSRVVRMTATSGFLQESAPNIVAHTLLSVPFVTKFAFLDAAMFLAEREAPAALQINGSNDAYSATWEDSVAFRTSLANEERLRRQWTAHQELGVYPNESITDVLSRLNWRSMDKSSCIVDVCSGSVDTVTSLAELHPTLDFLVQMEEHQENNEYLDRPIETQHNPHSRIMVQRGTSTGFQSVRDAAVYLVLLTTTETGLISKLSAVLEAHLGILQANASAVMIIAPPLLPEPGLISQEVEATVRSKDITNRQLMGQGRIEVLELTELVNSMRDEKGGLIVIHKLRFSIGATAAVSVKYSSFDERRPEA